MAENTNPPTTATPPASSGGMTSEQIAKIVKDTVTATVADALKPITTRMDELGNNVNTVADTLAKLPPSSNVKPEDVAKLVTDQLNQQAEAKATADAATTKKAEIRQKIIDTQLKGVPASLISSLPDTDDEAKLTAAAEAIRKDIAALPGVKLPDIGGVNKDGGITPASQPAQSGRFLKMA